MNFISKQKKYFLILFQLIAYTMAAQSFKAPQIAPLPPDVASQLKYIEVPVSNYNGTTQFSVPLYELNEGAINLPISLTYSSNGLKVDEEASSVGLGWNLNAGGFIQFIPQLDVQSQNLAPYGIDLNPSYELDYQANILQQGCTYQTPEGQNVSFDNTSDIMYYGFQYPLYVYNFNGYSGKFFITPAPNSKFVTIDKGNIVFEYLPVPADGFKATTPDGMQYIFENNGNARGSSLRLNYFAPCSGTVGVNGNTTSFTYNITKIISPTNDTVTFTYVDNLTKSLPSLSQWYTYDPIGLTGGALFTILYNDNFDKILSEINSSTTKIKFITSTRQDIYQGKKIDKIQIYQQSSSTPLRTVNFSTDYFIGTGGFGDFNTIPQATLGGCGTIQPQNFVTDDLKKKRLRLLSVDINGIESYKFNYSLMALPYKTSLAKDMWGYFNGVPNTTLLPNVNNLGYTDPEPTTYFKQHPFSGDRKSRESYMMAGMLTSIIQPTKGITEMAYESNSFITPPGTMQLQEVPVDVTDIGPGKDTKTFTVPNVGGQLTLNLNIKINCVGPGYPCSTGDCLGYGAAGLEGSQDNRLYVLIEKQNSNGTWSDFKYYDRLSSELDNYCSFVGYLPVTSGTYRVTANFPDNKTNGLNGGPWAQARIKYMDYVDGGISTNFGGGLRIKSIVNYDNSTQKTNEKYFEYGTGKLINRPDFIYVYDSNVQGSSMTPTTSDCIGMIQEDQFINCPMGAFNILHNETIYSESILPYSYNAMGALIGYGQVVIHYGSGDLNGKEVYNYNNNYDTEFPYPGRPPGITGTRRLDNGTVREKFVYRNSTPSAAIASTALIYYEKYEYEVREYKKYWNYKPDHHPATNVCSGSVVTSTWTDLSRNWMHFFPIVTGKVCLKKKTANEYDMVSGTPSLTVSNISNYSYNAKNQLTSETTTDSFNEVSENKVYSPHDMLAINVLSSEMQELVNTNRINTPVRFEAFKNGVKISEMQTKYSKDSSTGNILLEKEVHIKNGAANIDIATTTDRKFIYTKYDTKVVDGITIGNGKVIEYVTEGGTPVSIIYGYNKTLPVAKIENMSFASIPANLVTAIQDATNTGTEQQVITALNNLRINTALSQAMVTGYVHKPLVGVRYIIAPSGIKISYDYDSLGRLITVKDNDDKYLKEFQYNYRF
jgi:YD repeat-containing protein